MLTDAEILADIKTKNPNGNQEDVDAFRRFMKAFDCEDSLTMVEANERVLASMDMLVRDVTFVETYAGEDAARAIIAARFKDL